MNKKKSVIVKKFPDMIQSKDPLIKHARIIVFVMLGLTKHAIKNIFQTTENCLIIYIYVRYY